MDWFLYDRDLRHERVKAELFNTIRLIIFQIISCAAFTQREIKLLSAVNTQYEFSLASLLTHFMPMFSFNNP